MTRLHVEPGRHGERFGLSHYDSPIGRIDLIHDSRERLVALDFESYEKRRDALLMRYFPYATLARRALDGATIDALQRYFAGEHHSLDRLHVRIAGGAFRNAVWRALRTIPAGETITYKELAYRVGRPFAFRAVGAANGANPVALVLPCHRVIGASGTLTGYGGGLERKEALLRHEGVALRSDSVT